MMASTTSLENLDERMERIRKTNEQIEKKHREAEEDRILALKANAMISTKPPDESSWPKTHLYDEVDFKYETENSEELEAKRNEKKTLPLSLKTKEYKIFADIPPDPTYRFLYEPERDGPGIGGGNNNVNPNLNKNASSNQFHNKNNSSFDRRDRNERKSFGSNSKGYPNNRGRDGGNGGGNGKYNGPRDNMQRAHTQHEFDVNKTNEKDGNGRPFKPKPNGTKFNNTNGPPPANGKGGDRERGNNFQRSPQHSSTTGNTPPRVTKPQEEGFEKITKGNITVSVSKDGEVKSVKVSSTPPIGSGRVGFGQQSSASPFSFDDHNPALPANNIQQSSNNQRFQKQSPQQFNRNNNFDRSQPNRKSDKRNNNQQPQQQYHQHKSNNFGNNRSQGPATNNLEGISNLIPAIVKTNLQDRLQRNRSVTIDTQDNIKVSVTPTAGEIGAGKSSG